MDDKKKENSTKGLLFPRVKLKNIRTETDLASTMGATQGSLKPQEHIGLIVYNIGKNESNEVDRFCPGIHVWDGATWRPLKPYVEIREKLKSEEPIAGSFKRSFEYLDPTSQDNTNWPNDKVNDKDQRYALGQTANNGTDNVVDTRPNDTQQTYTASRFYVGYKVYSALYERQRNYSCDPTNETAWVDIEPIEKVEKIFDEGVWMTQNLRAMKMPDGVSLAKNTSSSNPNLSNPTYYLPNNASSVNTSYGALYNYAAAIGIGQANSPTTLPPNKLEEEGGSTSRDVTYQGICPQGWYLPSDQEWTDLANGIVNNVTLFSSTPKSSVSTVSYDSTLDSPAGGALGAAMKSTTAVSLSTDGTSNNSSNGGFDIYLVGTSGSALSVRPYEYGSMAYFWTSSRVGTGGTYPLALIRQFKRVSSSYFRAYHDAEQTFSVRCKKVTE